MKTKDDLKEAFAGESQANRRYTAFAKKADEEGYSQVAKLFRAAAAAETVHALSHLEALGDVKSTKENLQGAIEGETHEFSKMYPAMIKDAEEEGDDEAMISFTRANKVEEVHAGLYEKALEAVKDGADLKKKDIYVCSVCGNTVEEEAPDICPICGAKKEKFDKVE